MSVRFVLPVRQFKLVCVRSAAGNVAINHYPCNPNAYQMEVWNLRRLERLVRLAHHAVHDLIKFSRADELAAGLRRPGGLVTFAVLMADLSCITTTEVDGRRTLAVLRADLSRITTA